MSPVALVTGGAGGIAGACVRALLADGFGVAIVDRDPAGVRASPATRGVVCDAADPRAMTLAVEQITQDLGPITLAVGTVSVEQHGTVMDMTAADLELGVKGTAGAALALAQPVAAALIATGTPGRIVLVGSLHGSLAFPGAAAYNVAEAALCGLARSLARDLLPHRIAVNVVEPGWIDTPGERAFHDEQALALAAARQPWGRLGRPEDVAGAVAFLASPAAQWITGATLRVDGGMSLAMTDLPGAST